VNIHKCPTCEVRAPHSCASISEDGVYRWELRRRWATDGEVLLWVMLNPSTADGKRDDPTIRRCVDFSRRWGFAGLIIANLFSLRAKHPSEIGRHASPVGEKTDETLRAASIEAQVTVAAWGAYAAAQKRSSVVVNLLESELVCLGQTRTGAPRHPLYVRKDTTLGLWRSN
jgi:hypothetical protein